MRLLAISAALSLLVSGIGVATPIVVPPEPDQLLEGHTVFTLIEVSREINTTEENFAAAVAVLVRERVHERSASRFPGVLWFNDQYLVEPTKSGPSSTTRFRAPCTGAVIATDAGDITAIDYDLQGRPNIFSAQYGNESYEITDPNEHSWIVDLWNTSYGTHLWSVAIMNGLTNAPIPDDNRGCGTYNDNWCTYSNTSVTGRRCDRNDATNLFEPDRRRNATGQNNQPYRNVEYNALLYMKLEHLGVAGANKNHTELTGADWLADGTACDAGHPSYPCPGNNDDREGNSHPFNPESPWPINQYDGKNNHGGSADCDADGYAEQSCHATRRVDIYYGYAPIPPNRNVVFRETVGAEAPYHCHETLLACGPPVATPP